MSHWTKWLEISTGMSSRMMKNEMPGSEILTMITRAENVSLNWLTTGKGRPFVLGRHITQHEFASAIDAHLHDSSDWQISVIDAGAHPEHTLVVLQMPAELIYKTKTVSYTAIEVECGQWSVEAAALFENQDNVVCYHIPQQQKDNGHEFGLAVAGFAGTYRIKKLLAQLKPSSKDQVINKPVVGHQYSAVAESQKNYSSSNQVARIKNYIDGFGEKELEAIEPLCALLNKR